MTSHRGTEALVERLATELIARRVMLATAESCTGGWVAKALTDRPGSSAWFEFGFVTYGNNAKQELLGIEAGLIERHGAVSRQTAEAMAAGALKRSGADLAVAVTGIAGPDGGTVEKPAGTVWFAWQQRAGKVRSECVRFDGDRGAVRSQAVEHALAGLLKLLEGGSIE